MGNWGEKRGGLIIYSLFGNRWYLLCWKTSGFDNKYGMGEEMGELYLWIIYFFFLIFKSLLNIISNSRLEKKLVRLI